MFNKIFKKTDGLGSLATVLLFSVLILIFSLYVFTSRNAELKIRDATRKADLVRIASALELYKKDRGFYPPISDANTLNSEDKCGNEGRWCLLENHLKPYLEKIPADPLGVGSGFSYYYDSDIGDSNQTYGLAARMEHKDNYGLADNDGGYFNDHKGSFYEIGNKPAYCQREYFGSGQNWLTPGMLVCAGGN